MVRTESAIPLYRQGNQWERRNEIINEQQSSNFLVCCRLVQCFVLNENYYRKNTLALVSLLLIFPPIQYLDSTWFLHSFSLFIVISGKV